MIFNSGALCVVLSALVAISCGADQRRDMMTPAEAEAWESAELGEEFAGMSRLDPDISAQLQAEADSTFVPNER